MLSFAPELNGKPIVLEGLADEAATYPTSTLIEGLMPSFDTWVSFEMTLPYPRDIVYHAFEHAHLSDMPLFRALLALRSLGRTESLDDTPIIESLRHTDGILVEEDHGYEFALAYLGAFWTGTPFAPVKSRDGFIHGEFPAYARAVTNFLFEDVPGGTRVTSETRLQAPTEPAARRLFWVYWRLMGIVGDTVFCRSLLRVTRRHAGELAALLSAPAPTPQPIPSTPQATTRAIDPRLALVGAAASLALLLYARRSVQNAARQKG